MFSGIAESTLALHIEDWESVWPATMHLAYLPQNGTIRLRLSTYGEASAEEVETQIEALKPLVKEWLLGDEVIM
jgi:nicotinamide-nucleotide amidase